MPSAAIIPTGFDAVKINLLSLSVVKLSLSVIFGNVMAFENPRRKTHIYRGLYTRSLLTAKLYRPKNFTSLFSTVS